MRLNICPLCTVRERARGRACCSYCTLLVERNALMELKRKGSNSWFEFIRVKELTESQVRELLQLILHRLQVETILIRNSGSGIIDFLPSERIYLKNIDIES